MMLFHFFYFKFQSKFDIDMSKTYNTKYLKNIIGQQHQYIYDYYRHFKQFETVEEACLHPPNDVTQKDWDHFCNVFSLEIFKVSCIFIIIIYEIVNIFNVVLVY